MYEFVNCLNENTFYVYWNDFACKIDVAQRESLGDVIRFYTIAHPQIGLENAYCIE